MTIVFRMIHVLYLSSSIGWAFNMHFSFIMCCIVICIHMLDDSDLFYCFHITMLVLFSFFQISCLIKLFSTYRQR